MSAISSAADWGGKHPVTLAVGVFAVGAVILLLMRPRPVVMDNGMGAFYAAQSASANSGNQLAAVEAQVTGATAIAQIAASRDVSLASTAGNNSAQLADIAGKYSVQVNTIQAQTDTTLASFNHDVLMKAEDTRQQAQKQAYFQGVGQNAEQEHALPYLLQALMQGGTTATAAASVLNRFIEGGSQYYAAH
jgi:hypothetical protein